MKVRKVNSNKRILTESEVEFIKEHFHSMTNPQLAKALKIGLTSIRTRCYQLGLKRMEMEYWTDEQIDFLKRHYKLIGDVELAEIFGKKWHKDKGWTKKHIEKKRRYMKLKRTRKQQLAIHKRNKDNGRFKICSVKMWDKRGRAPEGSIKMWRREFANSNEFVAHIKVNGRYVHWNRWIWEMTYGPVPEGMNVVFKDGNNMNLSLDNLELISNGELARRNAQKSSVGLSDNYIAGILTHKDRELRDELKKDPELLDFKRQQLLLNRKISQHEEQNDRSA
jgi:hypothetical protein